MKKIVMMLSTKFYHEAGVTLMTIGLHSICRREETIVSNFKNSENLSNSGLAPGMAVKIAKTLRKI